MKSRAAGTGGGGGGAGGVGFLWLLFSSIVGREGSGGGAGTRSGEGMMGALRWSSIGGAGQAAGASIGGPSWEGGRPSVPSSRTDEEPDAGAASRDLDHVEDVAVLVANDPRPLAREIGQLLLGEQLGRCRQRVARIDGLGRHVAALAVQHDERKLTGVSLSSSA